MKILRCFAPVLLLATICVTKVLAAGDSPTVVNPNFDNVAVQCGSGYAYEAHLIGDCSGAISQKFNGVPGEGWLITPQITQHAGAGLTGPNTAFNPPSFSGLPFTQAVFLQNSFSGVDQAIPGFVAGTRYVLSFYLGSRYNSATDGNQTVVAAIDDQLIGSWSLRSFTPFQLQTVAFTVAVSGTHTLKFIGTKPGDHTAFLSGVSIQ